MFSHLKTRQIISFILIVLAVIILFLDDILFRFFYVWVFLLGAVFISRSLYKIFYKQCFIDCLFLCLFFLCLIIPSVNISKDVISKREYRELEPFPELINYDSINFNIGKNYENWIKDRFFGRQFLTDFYNNFVYKITVFVYKSDKAFAMKRSKFILFPVSKKVYDMNDIYFIGYNLKSFAKYLSSQGIKVYFVSFPGGSATFQNKNLVYSSSIKTFNDRTHYADIVDMSKILNKEFGVNFINMSEIYESNQKKAFVNYKTDHHSTDWGYYLTYRTLMNRIKKDFPDVKINSINDFRITKNRLVRTGVYSEYYLTVSTLRKIKNYKNLYYSYGFTPKGQFYLYNLMNFNIPSKVKRFYDIGVQHRTSGVSDKSILDTDYLFFDYKYLKNIKSSLKGRALIFENSGRKYKVLLLGDSNIVGLSFFLATSFAHVYAKKITTKYNSFAAEKIQNLVDSFNPDIVIIYHEYARLDSLKNIYSIRQKGVE